MNGSTPLFAYTDVSDSIYTQPFVPLGDLLHPFPQFPGSFSGFPLFVATSSYHSFQARIEKRASHGLNFLTAYTFSKFITDSDAGGNAWIGNLGFSGAPQDLNNLAAEKSVSANDTPQRLVFAATYELPLGHGRAIGGGMNGILDAVIGGWQTGTIITLQSGQPITIFEATGYLTDGHQRPNVTGNPCTGANILDIVNVTNGGPGTANYFNSNVLSDPPNYSTNGEFPGDAPRYFSNCRVQGLKNVEFGLSKKFQIRESMYVEARGEFSNFFNTPRFAAPNEAFNDPSFGLISSQANKPRQGQIGLRFVF